MIRVLKRSGGGWFEGMDFVTRIPKNRPSILTGVCFGSPILKVMLPHLERCFHDSGPEKLGSCIVGSSNCNGQRQRKPRKRKLWKMSRWSLATKYGRTTLLNLQAGLLINIFATCRHQNIPKLANINIYIYIMRFACLCVLHCADTTPLWFYSRRHFSHLFGDMPLILRWRSAEENKEEDFPDARHPEARKASLEV